MPKEEGVKRKLLSMDLTGGDRVKKIQVNLTRDEDETNNVVVPEAEHIVEINTAYENINTDLLNSV